MSAIGTLLNLAGKPGEGAPAAPADAAELFASLVADAKAAPVPVPVPSLDIEDAPAEPGAEVAQDLGGDVTPPFDAAALLPLIEAQRAAAPTPTAPTEVATPLARAATPPKVSAPGPSKVEGAERPIEPSAPQPTEKPTVAEPSRVEAPPAALQLPTASAEEGAMKRAPEAQAERGEARSGQPVAPPAVKLAVTPPFEEQAPAPAKLQTVEARPPAAGPGLRPAETHGTAQPAAPQPKAVTSAKGKAADPVTPAADTPAEVELSPPVQNLPLPPKTPAEKAAKAPPFDHVQATPAPAAEQPLNRAPQPRAASPEAAAEQPASAAPAQGNGAPAPASSQPSAATASPTHVAVAPQPILAPAVAPAPAPQPAMSEQILDLSRGSEWIDDLARDIAKTTSADGALRFRLNPNTLGELRVEITQSERGAHVRLEVTSEAAQQALTEAQPRLAAEARAQGVRLAEAEVSLAGSNSEPRGSGRQQEQGQGQSAAPVPRALRGASTNVSTEPGPAERRATERYA